MTLNVYLLIPEDTTFDTLTEEQQQGINDVFGQYRMPMSGTKAHDGTVVCDAICDDTFNPEAMQPLGLDWEIIGMWNRSGETLVPLDEAKFLAHLQDKVTYDMDGNVVSTEPPTLHQPHVWSGWPRWDT